MKESQREGRHGSSHAAWSDEGCAQHRQESSAWKVQLKEATPALSKRKRSSTASFELPEQHRQQRNNSLDYGTQTMFGNSCMERGEICLQICWVTEVGRGNLGGIRNTTQCRKGG